MTTFAPWQAGQTITADRLNATAPLTWSSWTPAWSTTTGANKSTYGNATIDCRYVEYGLMVQFSINITFGSTTTFSTASDNWTFGLPTPAAMASGPIGFVAMYTGNTTDATPGMAALYDTGRFMIYTAGGNVDASTTLNGGIADSQSPILWAAGHSLTAVGQYQSAAS